jgi:cupin 2 domain-containing protein
MEETNFKSLVGNLLNLEKIELPSIEEKFISIINSKNIKIERIISSGQITEEGVWLEQDNDEFVVLISGEAKIKLENLNEVINLKVGDYMLIPKNSKHRVEYTSTTKPTIWLAIHFNMK